MAAQREEEILFLIRETREPFFRLNLLKGESLLFISMDFPFLNLIEFPRKFLLKHRSKMNLRFLASFI